MRCYANAPLLARTVRDIISAGRAYFVTDHRVHLLPGVVRNVEVAETGAAWRGIVAERTRLESELLEIVDLMAALHGLAAQTRGLFDVCCHVSVDGDTPGPRSHDRPSHL